MRKYHNSRVDYDGYTFDSKAEKLRYEQLLLLTEAGEISNLRVHPKYTLQKSFDHKYNGRVQAITYTADFEYRDLTKGVLVVEDVKGMKTPTYRNKRKMFLNIYRNIYFGEVTAETNPELFPEYYR